MPLARRPRRRNSTGACALRSRLPTLTENSSSTAGKSRRPATSVRAARVRLRLRAGGRAPRAGRARHRAGGGDWWDWIVGPGRVWQDGDSGWSRASVPFALIEKNANCMHHGLLTFRYRGERRSRASRTRCPTRPATTSSSTPGDGGGDTGGGCGHRPGCRRRRVSQRGLAPPAGQADRADPEGLPGPRSRKASARRRTYPRDMTVFGVLIRGVHYTGGCETRRDTTRTATRCRCRPIHSQRR